MGVSLFLTRESQIVRSFFMSLKQSLVIYYQVQYVVSELQYVPLSSCSNCTVVVVCYCSCIACEHDGLRTLLIVMAHMYLV